MQDTAKHPRNLYEEIASARKDREEKMQATRERIIALKGEMSALSVKVADEQKELRRLADIGWKEHLTAVASAIARKLGADCRVSGPAGLRCEWYLAFFSKTEKEQGTDRPMRLATLCVMPHTSGGKNWLVYDTGALVPAEERHAPGTLGATGGFNNETAPLPETLEEITELVKSFAHEN